MRERWNDWPRLNANIIGKLGRGTGEVRTAGISMFLRLEDRAHSWGGSVICILALFYFLTGYGGEGFGDNECPISCESE